MTLVLGIDPGLNGAMAVYDDITKRVVCVDDVPTWVMNVGKKKRNRLDNLAAMELFDTYSMMGVELAVLENVGGRPKQSASAAFVFGWVASALYQMMLERKMSVETTPPGTWKKLMKIPGKVSGKTKDEKTAAAKAAKEAIWQRTVEMFPKDMELFSTKKGAKRMDRAEAAMLARFGAEHVLRVAGGLQDIEYEMAYRKADIGA